VFSPCNIIQLNKAVMTNQGCVTSALKRLIGCVSSSRAGCQYCQAHTILAAERYGAESDQLANICQYSAHPSFSAAERAALDFAVAASSVPNGVEGPVVENLRKYWNEGEIVEILGVISLFGYLSR
jgi:alkylhydroperoxidase family enzyme